jgi:hypothetical protein
VLDHTCMYDLSFLMKVIKRKEQLRQPSS